MKFTNQRGFDKHLAEAAPHHFAPVYLLINKEDFDRKEIVKTLSRLLLKNLPNDEHHIKRFDASEHSFKQLMQELGAYHFFAKKRVIILENAQELKKEETELLEYYFSNPDPSIYLIFAATAINRAARFYKQVEKAGVILDLEEKKPWEKEAALVSFLIQWFKEQGISVPSAVAQSIVKTVNQDKFFLQQEMEKLLCFLGERKELTSRDVAAVGSGSFVQNIWQLGDAIFNRQGSLAIEIACQLLNSGENFIALLRSLRTQFQTRLLGAVSPPEEVQSRYPYLRGQMLHKQIQQAQKYGAAACRKGLLLIDETELLAKNGAFAPNLLLEKLLFQLVIL